MGTLQIIRMVSRDNITGNVVSSGFDQLKHWHPDIEFVFLKKGKLSITFDDTNISLSKGELFIIPGNVVHCFISATDNSILHIARIPTKSIENVDTKGAVELDDFYKKCTLVRPSPDFVRIFQQLVFANHGKFNELYVLSKIYELSINLLSTEKIIRTYDCTQIEDYDLASKIQSFVENSFCQDLTLKLLADHLNISETYCSKIVKQKTNFSFKNYVNRVRLREAGKYLRTTNMHITEICYATGFNSIQSFNRNFLKMHGVTPSEYRKGNSDPNAWYPED